MVKKDAAGLAEKIGNIKQEAKGCLKEYLEEYAPYGMDSTANGLIQLVAGMDAIRCELKYAMVEDRKGYL